MRGKSELYSSFYVVKCFVLFITFKYEINRQKHADVVQEPLHRCHLFVPSPHIAMHRVQTRERGGGTTTKPSD